MSNMMAASESSQLYEIIGAALDQYRAFYYAHWNVYGQSYHLLLKQACDLFDELADSLAEPLRGVTAVDVQRVPAVEVESPRNPEEARDTLLDFFKSLHSEDRGIENLFCSMEEKAEALADLFLNLYKTDSFSSVKADNL